ncbi:unnamed protein product [Bursaphelenchus xylophilus]|uniref:ATP-dependent RNA helicase n=1 Tax=Bursaphelenchus xylophilus TaxID=6326 RepID=A0A1I7S0X4_BURXY|nr:unnamed protein product [Bursaphelenchus xylophilus]CAG9087842.1 unnamed protein product [Bursaphelenchus xylophilus]
MGEIKTAGLYLDFDGLPEWDDFSDEEDEEVSEDEEQHKQKPEVSLKVLGEHTFKDVKSLTSVPKWAENAVEFDGNIRKSKGGVLESYEGLDQQLFDAVSKQINSWFPVQKTVLPQLINETVKATLFPSRDIAISAPTGSGKTLCYLLPIINSFSKPRPKDKVFALILAPLPALVRQIANEFAKLNVFNTKIVALKSKLSFEDEKRILFPEQSEKSDANIIISTPDRLIQHILDEDNGSFDFSQLRYLVVDEADGMFMPRENFLDLIETMANCPKNHPMSYKSLTDGSKNTRLQKILVSATLSLEADKLHDWNLRCPKLYKASAKKAKEKKVENTEEGDKKEEPMEVDGNEDIAKFTLPQKLKQEVRICKSEFKPLLVYRYLKCNPEWKKVLVFVNTISSSQRLKMLLEYLLGTELKVAEISSNIFGRRRFRLLQGFKNGNINVVISAGSLGRGMDVPDIDCVINYDIPSDSHVYIHRAGRTARAGKKGTVVTLSTKEERLKLKKNLIAVGIWDPEAENKEKDLQFIEEYKDQYQKALDALKERLESIGKS